MGAPGETKLLQREGKSQKGCDTTGGDEIMPAGMSNARQSIVLGIEIDLTPARSAHCFERGGETVRMASNGETLALEKRADRIVGMVFFVRELGV